MIKKGTMQPIKKILGYIIGIIGILLIIIKETTLNFVTNTGFFIDKFYFSVLSILLIISAYFLIIAGRRI